MLLLHGEYALAEQGVGTASGPQFTITVNPSAVVIKVGDKATVNLTVTGDGTTGLVCFGEQGFPSSGFTLTFVPQCAAMQQPMVDAQLVVEATPAAAPQNFTALIQASLSNQTASTPLTITVVPAIPAWIPWLGIALFFLVIGAALFVKPRKRKDKGKKGE
jgi:hypothetical protein